MDGCSIISKPSLLPLNLIFIKTKEDNNKKTHTTAATTTICYLRIVFSALTDVAVCYSFFSFRCRLPALLPTVCYQ